MPPPAEVGRVVGEGTVDERHSAVVIVENTAASVGRVVGQVLLVSVTVPLTPLPKLSSCRPALPAVL